MPRRRTDVEAGLEAKGFRRSEGHHHFFVYFTLDGVKTSARTRTSHGMRDIPDNLLSQMAQQCKVTRAQFLDLVDCSISRADYEELLRQNGHI